MRLSESDWTKLRKQITEHYNEGGSLRAIAELIKQASGCSVSHTTICTRLDSWGVNRRTGVYGRKAKDLSGCRFGKLRVICRDGRAYPLRWLCRCDCGNRRSYPASRLKRIASCGCAPRGPRKITTKKKISIFKKGSV